MILEPSPATSSARLIPSHSPEVHRRKRLYSGDNIEWDSMRGKRRGGCKLKVHLIVAAGPTAPWILLGYSQHSYFSVAGPSFCLG